MEKSKEGNTYHMLEKCTCTTCTVENGWWAVFIRWVVYSRI